MLPYHCITYIIGDVCPARAYWECRLLRALSGACIPKKNSEVKKKTPTPSKPADYCKKKKSQGLGVGVRNSGLANGNVRCEEANVDLDTIQFTRETIQKMKCRDQDEDRRQKE
jgi:hypothetical protein